jgi:hypothetical protein
MYWGMRGRDAALAAGNSAAKSLKKEKKINTSTRFGQHPICFPAEIRVAWSCRLAGKSKKNRAEQHGETYPTPEAPVLSTHHHGKQYDPFEHSKELTHSTVKNV